MPGFPVPFIKFSAYDANGYPLAAGKLSSFEAGTSTPLATYTTHVVPPDVLAVPNANPTILDAQGRAAIFIPDGVGYKFTLTDALDNVIWTLDNIMVPEIEPPETPSEVPPGGMVLYGGAVAPTGWLLCDGTAVSRFAPNAALFAILGEQFGPGNGSTTFNLPDLRQRFPLGKAVSGTGATLGSSGGFIDHTHTGPSHTHTIASHVHSLAAHTHSVPFNGWSNALAIPPANGVLSSGGSGVGAEASVTQATANNVTGASTVTDTGAIVLTTDAGGTAVTGTQNPAFLTVTFIIKV